MIKNSHFESYFVKKLLNKAVRWNMRNIEKKLIASWLKKNVLYANEFFCYKYKSEKNWNFIKTCQDFAKKNSIFLSMSKSLKCIIGKKIFNFCKFWIRFFTKYKNEKELTPLAMWCAPDSLVENALPQDRKDDSSNPIALKKS